MKKRIIFIINNLNVGGIEKSVINVINALSKEKYDITLGVISKSGGLIDKVPSHVNLLEIPLLKSNIRKVSGRFNAIIGCIRNRDLKNALVIPWLYVKSKLTGTLIPLYSYFINQEYDEMPEYDVAVAFQGPNELIDFYVSHVIKAKKKYGWIHFDIEKCFIRKKTVLKCYSNFDGIMVVSEHAKRQFDNMFPSLSDRTEVMLNIIDKEECVNLSKEKNGVLYDKGVVNLCTVGRISKQKAQDIAIYAAGILKKRGIKFHWYFIGNGNKLDEYKELAINEGLERRISFLGNQLNPYKFMAQCDVYVQPSRYEGYCIAIGEAKLFGVPIVASDFVGAKEQLTNVPNAIIIDELTPLTLADAICKALQIGKITPEYEGNIAQIERLEAIF